MGQMSVENCDHFVTENGKCITCGEPHGAPRWTMEELRKIMDEPEPEAFRSKYLNEWENSNIPAISKLSDETWTEYDRQATANEEPDCPQRPRLRMIGGRLLRIPFHQIWKEVVGLAFDEARKLGYRGDWSKWQQLVKESCPPEPRHP
jgi:hypothetical protein